MQQHSCFPFVVAQQIGQLSVSPQVSRLFQVLYQQGGIFLVQQLLVQEQTYRKQRYGIISDQ